jgi:hypothetical protein
MTIRARIRRSFAAPVDRRKPFHVEERVCVVRPVRRSLDMAGHKKANH